MLTVVIIDDEPKAIELLKGYIKRVPFLDCVKTFRHPYEGLEYLKTNTIDILLLDINMPKLSGISLAQVLNPSINVIFTTAYSEYAVESYDLNAVDYLLKPIAFERFFKAISKVEKSINSSNNSLNTSKEINTQNSVLIKSGYTLHRVNLDDILYLEKDANYMIYHTFEKSIMARESIQGALEKLNKSFVQIHKSYIVPIGKIKAIESNHVIIKEIKLPIGKNYKDEFMNVLGNP
ncbi:MAG: LytTR family DNA-binding domain-containing protein [Flavobacteriaceae bacterium]|nr:LytTR family DNA-binding domain-containing protein [Flavobacteriaceae bacterium]